MMNKSSRPEPIHMILANMLMALVVASVMQSLFWLYSPFSLTVFVQRVFLTVLGMFVVSMVREFYVRFWGWQHETD